MKFRKSMLIAALAPATLLAAETAGVGAPTTDQTATGAATLARQEEGPAPLRLGRALENFAALQGRLDPATVARTQLPLIPVLRAFSAVTQGFDESGQGNVDYWMKTTRDFARSGRALGYALEGVAFDQPAGPVRATLASLAVQLTSLSEAGHGNVDYWLARCQAMGQQVRGVGSQLSSLASGLGAGGGGETASMAAVVAGFGRLSLSPNYGGEGNVDYWMRTTQTFVRLGRAVGRGLERVAGATPPPMQGVLFSYASQLGSLSAAGHGNVDYWMARAQGVAQQMDAIGNALNTLASNS